MSKSIIKRGAAALWLGIGMSLISCSGFLDREANSYIDKDMTFSSYIRTQQYLTNIYTLLPDGLTRMDGNAMFDAATDDAEFALQTAEVQSFNTGAWNAATNPDNPWDRCYMGIRMACELMDHADEVNLDAYRLDPKTHTEYENRKKDIRIWKAEARFLRAFFHFELLKRFGPVPIVKSSLSISGDYSGMARPSMDECVKFIVNECDTAAKYLDLKPWRDDTALGHATKGAALALKSRVLLYAASPLYLDYENLDETNLPTNAEKWELAAKAAKAVIDLGAYQLATSYGQLFQNQFQSTEYIFMRRYTVSDNVEKANFPVSFGGTGGTNPSVNLLDSYEMTDGTDFSWTNPTQAANPYADRDSRMDATFLFNEQNFHNGKVECYIGGKDGLYQTNATTTGHYLRKYLNKSVNIQTGGGKLGHTFPFFRLAEIYLNYAEALNEYAPDNADIARYVNLVRERADQHPLPSGLTQDEMRQRIRRERRVELAFEEHRAWDVRRWKVASSTLGAPLRGLRIERDNTQATPTYTYTPYVVERRAFQPKMYWYPIPQSELMKLVGWKQNPQW